MGHIKKYRVVELLHDAKAEHVYHQVVIAERAAALTEYQLLIASFFTLGQDVAHFLWRKKLRFLDIDDRIRFRHCHHQIGLA